MYAPRGASLVMRRTMPTGRIRPATVLRRSTPNVGFRSNKQSFDALNKMDRTHCNAGLGSTLWIIGAAQSLVVMVHPSQVGRFLRPSQ